LFSENVLFDHTYAGEHITEMGKNALNVTTPARYFYVKNRRLRNNL
jgi:hypothetical protein